MKTLTLSQNKPEFKDEPEAITTAQEFKKADEKARTLSQYLRCIHSQIDMINAQIELRENLEQWFVIEYMKQQKILLIAQAKELYNEHAALDAQITAYLSATNNS